MLVLDREILFLLRASSTLFVQNHHDLLILTVLLLVNSAVSVHLDHVVDLILRLKLTVLLVIALDLFLI